MRAIRIGELGEMSPLVNAKQINSLIVDGLNTNQPKGGFMKAITRRHKMDRKIVEKLIQGKGVKKITPELRADKRRIRRVRDQAIEMGYVHESGKGKGNTELPPYPTPIFDYEPDGRAQKISENHRRIGEYHNWIKTRLELGWHAITVYEEFPISVSRSSFYRYLEKYRLSRMGEEYRRVIPEIIHEPGESLQLDWGKLRTIQDPEAGQNHTVYLLVGVLCFSRYMMVELVWSNNIETTMQAIKSMFEEIEGIPVKITSDNPKCFAMKADQYEPLLNPSFERFANHYSTILECLPPNDPQKKGKVERLVSYARRLFEGYGNEWGGMEDAQTYMNKKLKIANQRKHGTTNERPIDRFLNQEKQALKSLPSVEYEIEQYHEGEVRKDGHIRFKGKYYSVDEAYIGKTLSVLGSSRQVSIFYKNQLIETHERLKDPNRSKSTKSHHLKPWERSMHDSSFYLKQAEKLGEHVKNMVYHIIQQGHGFIDTRKVFGILSLDKTYEPKHINEACKEALEIESYSYQTVLKLVKIKKKGGANQKEKQKKNYSYERDVEEYENQINMFFH